MMTTATRRFGGWSARLAVGTVLLLGGTATGAAQSTGTPAATSISAPATAIVYVTIENSGTVDETLVSAETAAAQTVELHESVDDDGVVRMEPRPDGIGLPAGTTTPFDAGGLHVMLVGLTADLRAGDAYDLTLQFANAGEATVPVAVRFTEEPDDDEPAADPVTVGDLIIRDAWSRPAPALLGLATPAAGGQPGLDTPVVVDGLTIVLTADGAAAGPRDLTVLVSDATGQPVADAAVTISTNSLVMDHGVSTREAEMVEPGRYIVDNVPMGMGGDWQAEVAVTRPGAEPAVVVFVVTLEGP